MDLSEILQGTCVGLHVKCPLLVSDFNETNFLGRFFEKNIQISNVIKFHPVGDELFHVDGQTNRHDEAKSRFSQFYERV